jgi:hypothetical protein
MSFYDDEYLRDMNIEVVKATGKRCIVCGDKKGNCSTTDEGPRHIVMLGQEEKMLKVDEVTFDEDIFEDKEIAPGVWAKTLVARAGRPIKKKKAMDLGII